MHNDIKKIVKWAQSQGWTIEDDSKGYTHFYDPNGDHVTYYPATPSNPYRRMRALEVELRKRGLPWPAPGKKEQRSQRGKGQGQ